MGEAEGGRQRALGKGAPPDGCVRSLVTLRRHVVFVLPKGVLGARIKIWICTQSSYPDSNDWVSVSSRFGVSSRLRQSLTQTETGPAARSQPQVAQSTRTSSLVTRHSSASSSRTGRARAHPERLKRERRGNVAGAPWQAPPVPQPRAPSPPRPMHDGARARALGGDAAGKAIVKRPAPRPAAWPHA